MAIVKAQFNSSTLKASYNTSTNKQQTLLPEACNQIVELTFAGITECEGGNWPSNINGSYQIEKTSENPSYCHYVLETGGWTITFSLPKATFNVKINADYPGYGDNGAFGNYCGRLSGGGPCSNAYQEGSGYDCGDAHGDHAENIVGVGGSVTWRWIA